MFGSNLAGEHLGGAARAAAQTHGAQWGAAIGPTGRAYAIPSLGPDFERLPIGTIAAHVADFIAYAAAHPHTRFFVTRIGCGIAGFRDEEIAPLFAAAPANCSFAETWRPYLDQPQE